MQAFDWIVPGASYVASYQARACWDGGPDENSGYFMQGVGCSAAIRLAPGVTLIPAVLRVFSIDTRGSGDSMAMDRLVGLSMDLAQGDGSSFEQPGQEGPRSRGPSDRGNSATSCRRSTRRPSRRT